MKMMKRLLSVVLALLMLMSLLPLSALSVAAAEPGAGAIVMELDETYDVEIDEEGDCVLFSFTAPRGASYSFYAYNEDGDPKATLYDEDMNKIETNDDYSGVNFRITHTMAAGETVYLEAYMYGSETGSYSLEVQAMQAPTGIILNIGEAYTTYVGQYLYLSAQFTPQNAYREEITYTSSNETVLEQDGDDQFYAVDAGTATITATSESGLTASCVVTVAEIPTLEINMPSAFTLNTREDRAIFAFTPTENGYYEFVVRAEDGGLPNLYYELERRTGSGSNDSGSECFSRDNYFVIRKRMTANCQYHLSFDKDDDEDQPDFAVYVTKLPEATGITIDCPTTMLQGTSQMLQCNMVPEDAVVNDITYVSSDEDVLMIEDGCYLYAVSVGTATITATTDSGLSASLSITVEDYPMLQLNETVSLEIANEDEPYMARFVPATSGYYRFTSSNTQDDPYIRLYDADRNCLDEDDDGGDRYNFNLVQYLYAGDTYYVYVYTYDEDTTLDLTITKPPKATKIAIQQGTTASAHQGGTGNYTLVYTPADAVREDVKWTTSNANVVKILNSSDESVRVLYKGAGKATLTAQTATTKLKATITITVTAATTVALNTPKTGTITKTRRNYSFKYTPSASGTYVINVASNKNVGLTLTTGNEVVGSGSVGERTTARLVAKKTYYFSFNFYEEETGEFAFLLYKQKAVTGIKLEQTAYVGVVGDRFNLWNNTVTLVPTMQEANDVEWEVEDEDVAYVEESELVLIGKGTTTLYVYAEGKVTTATITVQDQVITPYTIGDEVTVSYNANTNKYWYSFQVPTDGTYIFQSTGDSDADPILTIYDSQWESFDGDDDGGVGYHFHLTTDLSAGRTYYAMVRMYNDNSFEDFQWSGAKAVAPTAIEIVSGDLRGYVGNWFNVEVSFVPGNGAFEPYSIAVEGDAVMLEDNELVLQEPGTARVTVTTQSGLTDSITVTALEPQEMEEGRAYALDMSTRKQQRMAFTPETSGVYSFFTNQATTSDLDIFVEGREDYPDQYYYSYPEEGESAVYLMQAHLTAGETYTVYVNLYRGEIVAGDTISVIKAENKGIPTIRTETTKVQGTSERLQLVGQDPNTAYAEVLGWTTSDPKIATVDAEGYVRYIRAGKVTFTAQTANGDAKVTVTVVAATAMTQGKEYVAKIVDDKHTQFKFAPKKDGYYTFYIYGNNGQNGLGVEIMDSQGSYLDGRGDVASNTTVYLVAGQTYYPIVDFRSGGPDIVPTTSYKVKVGSGSAPKDTKNTFKIINNPYNTYVPTGEMAVVQVNARGEGLTYKWYYANKGKYTYAASSITTDTYSVKMDSTRDGRKLFCVVTDKYGNKMTSNIVTIGIKKPLKITTQLTNAVAKSGTTVKASFVASGDGLKYTWYYKDAGATDFAVTTSFTSNSYSTTMNSTRANRQVFCVVTDKYGNSVKTSTVTLFMGTPIKITTQPKSVKVKNGATAKVTVKAQGDGLTYAWYIKNKGASKYSKSSVTKSTYSVKMSTKVNGRLVYCVVKDKYGKTVKSTTVSLKKK